MDWSIHAVDFEVEPDIDDDVAGMATLRVTYRLQYRPICVFEQKLTIVERYNFVQELLGGLSDGFGEDSQIKVTDKEGREWDVRID